MIIVFSSLEKDTPMKVMIVDDNRVIHELIRDALLPDVSDFTDCADGDEAVEMYRLCRPDWVLMDVMMKRMDGLKATEAIIAEDPGAKIIIITQHTEPGIREQAMQAGATGFVLKDNLEDIARLVFRGHN